MIPYNLEYQVNKAIRIAENDEQAVVGVFCKWNSVAAILANVEANGMLKHTSRTFTTNSGGVVKFIDLPRCDLDYTVSHLCGAVFTHIFCGNLTDSEQINYVRSRLRSAYKHEAEPMGYYDSFGVQRYEAY